MREIVILSGKGGTGKTSLTAAFAHLANGHVICDLDVDAPDLHLILQPDHGQQEAFISGHEAVIRPADCARCDQCRSVCRYDAILEQDPPSINPLKCEGCKLCVAMCPSKAIDFLPKHCGDWYRSTSRFGAMVHAQLFPAEENSGRLVALLRQQARALAEAEGARLILCDGPPGIGCPVISALSGADLAVIVTEPTVSGRHDLERVLDLCRHFAIPAGVIINKCDLNPDQAAAIEQYCRAGDLPLIGSLPHDAAFTQAMIRGLGITEYDSDRLSKAVTDAWKTILALAAPQQSDNQAVGQKAIASQAI